MIIADDVVTATVSLVSSLTPRTTTYWPIFESKVDGDLVTESTQSHADQVARRVLAPRSIKIFRSFNRHDRINEVLDVACRLLGNARDSTCDRSGTRLLDVMLDG